MTTVNTDVIDRVIAVVIVTADRSVTSHAWRHQPQHVNPVSNSESIVLFDDVVESTVRAERTSLRVYDRSVTDLRWKTAS